MLLYVMIVTGSMSICLYFGLDYKCMAIFLIYCILLVPFFIRNSNRNRYEQQRFSDVNTYIEQFLYSFGKEQKVLVTLEECLLIFHEGMMQDTLMEAIDQIRHDYDNERPEEEGLALIEKAYSCDLIYTIHHFAMTVEQNGGDCRNSINLLLESRQMWANRTYALLKEKNHQRINIILSVATSLLLCSMVGIIAKRMDFNIGDSIYVRIITLIVLMLDVLIILAADKKLSYRLLEEENESDESIIETYNRIDKYKDNRPFDMLAKKAATKRIKRALERDFPKWLMEVALLLESENVQVAIFKSFDAAPITVKPLLEELIAGIKAAPESIEPYLSFAKEFELPEISSSMKLLYSLSEGGMLNVSNSISEIIKQNQRMLDLAAKHKNEDIVAGMYALFLAPQLTGGLKLMVDMLVILVMYLGNI